MHAPVDGPSFSSHAERAWLLGNEVLAYLASGHFHEAMAVMLHRDQELAAVSLSFREVPDRWRCRLLAQTDAIYRAALKLTQQIARQRDETLAGRPALRAYAAAKCVCSESSKL